ncbi:hypothetical protein F0P96_03350 [Hymenobacter busanensis]|uniref:Uncharacterized protein n=1 Tax=Hymenobacter busanensis TaxID=2607656 RepID=A0A7L4ZWK3_9BACT|nr:hypothetical protein [Hymenobacter busanensis]KAA9339663.1 hypothetical protein F0P96_03350 [Hymenobacter busanensis]QHJ06582.1 hypothetical protein GUY19_04400 [Hymenobacter busanensis]
MNIISTLWGIVVLLLAVLALFPLLGWANWFILILAVIGLIIGAFGKRRTGLILNGVAILIACLRLFIGGGII